MPFGEDAVLYFEEREFQRRFPEGVNMQNYPQVRGENKVTVPKQSGMQPRVAREDDKGSDLSKKGGMSARSWTRNPESKSSNLKTKPLNRRNRHKTHRNRQPQLVTPNLQTLPS